MLNLTALEEMIVKGSLTSEVNVGGVKVGYKTLSHDEEVTAINKSVGQPYVIKVEQLSLAITHINGEKVVTDEDRKMLREKLGKLSSNYINAFYEPYLTLYESVPKLNEEGLNKVLGESPASQEASTNSAFTVTSRPTTP